MLAGITISLISSNSLLQKTKQSKNETIYSKAEEKVKLAVNSSYDNNANLNKEMLKENLNKIEGINPKIEVVTYDLTVTVDGYQFTITGLGKVTKKNKEENPNINYEKEKQNLALMEHFDKDIGVVINSNQITTKDKKVGNSSLYLNNTQFVDSITKKFLFDNDFTIEYWTKLSSENLKSTWAVQLAVSTNYGILLGLYNGKFVVRGWNAINYLELDPPPMDEWAHIAVTRKDGIIYVFYNGILQGSVENQITFSNGNLCIGFEGSQFHTKDSYIDELKILNGIAKYTSNFSITDEVTRYDNEIIYHFENDNNIEASNARSSFENKKFGTSSIFFNNSYIKYKIEDGTYKFDKDFTIDYWLNQSKENLKENWSIHLSVATKNGIMLVLNNGKFAVRGWDVINYIELDPPPMDEWVHIAVTRKDGVLYVFYNGILQDSVENNTTFNNGSLFLGCDGTKWYEKETYIDELRILNGYCAWTENFEVPKAQYEY